MRELIRQLPGSKIREVANAGLGRSDVLAFWFGEGDEVTPGFVRDAAVASLKQGETFYSHNLGCMNCAKRWPAMSVRSTGRSGRSGSPSLPRA